MPKASSGNPTGATALVLFCQKDTLWSLYMYFAPRPLLVAMWEKLCLSTELAPCPLSGGQQCFLFTVQWGKQGNHISASLGRPGEQAQGSEGLTSAVTPLLPCLMLTEARKEVIAEA